MRSRSTNHGHDPLDNGQLDQPELACIQLTQSRGRRESLGGAGAMLPQRRPENASRPPFGLSHDPKRKAGIAKGRHRQRQEPRKTRKTRKN